VECYITSDASLVLAEEGDPHLIYSLFWSHGDQPATGRVALAARSPFHLPLPHLKRWSLSGVGAMVAL
jgi:hypothetical protein